MKSFYPYPLLSALAIYYVSPFEANAEFSIVAATVKALPILYLILYMRSNLKSFQSTGKSSPRDQQWKERRSLATGLTYGFVFSAIGDVLLLIRLKDDFYMEVGTLAFAVAQLCNIYAFGFRVTRIKLGLGLYLSTAALSTYILWEVPSPLKLVLTGYGALLVTAVWRSLDRMQHEDGRSSSKKLMLAAGMLCFLSSDFWLSFSTFVLQDTCVDSMYFILLTYYGAQGLMALAST